MYYKNSHVRLATALLLVLTLAIGMRAENLPEDKAAPPSSFIAAVYQHAPHESILPNMTRAQALSLMNENVDVYEEKITIAASKGAMIIVFPEYGITGLQLSYQTIVPFLESVPNPYERSVNPCLQPEFQRSPILRRLSCLARDHDIIVVANLATMENCSQRDRIQTACPPDGLLKYNTDVALNRDGHLLAKYNKENLYAEENHIFQPGSGGLDNLAVFETNFGIFGLFTCFDMLFKEPVVTLVSTMGVTNMIFPTAWVNELPLLSAIEYQEAWSIGYDINLLAANIQFPLIEMAGGGLFAGTEGAVMYHYDMRSYKGALLIGELPVRSARPPRVHTLAFAELRDRMSKLNAKELQKITPFLRRVLIDNLDTAPTALPQSKRASATNVGSFKSLMNHDLYTFVLVTQSSGTASVCSQDICCHLNYTFESSVRQRQMFALGVFNGLHTNNGQYYIQACALVKCKEDVLWNCGAPVTKSDTRFGSFSLAGQGFDPKTVVFPSVLTSDVRLAVLGKDWVTGFPFHRISSENGTRNPLLVASIFGRLYDKD